MAGSPGDGRPAGQPINEETASQGTGGTAIDLVLILVHACAAAVAERQTR
jgi:hypothetical protein